MIEAIIHVHNRTQYLERAISAAVASAASTGALVRISSNATDELSLIEASRLADKYDIGFTAGKTNTAFDHFKRSVTSARMNYVCLLHDDDFVSLEYFHLLGKLIEAFPGAAAYAPDANFLIGSWLHCAAFKPRQPFRLSPKWLALLYLVGRCGPPFPCIVYRRGFARSVFSRTPVFSKYSDAPIVLEAALAGLWITPEPIFTYALGTQNDSGIVDECAKRRLWWWLVRQLFLNNSSKSIHFYSNFQFFLGRFLKKRQGF